MGSPQDAANAIFFLSSPDAGYATGTGMWITGDQHQRCGRETTADEQGMAARDKAANLASKSDHPDPSFHRQATRQMVLFRRQ